MMGVFSLRRGHPDPDLLFTELFKTFMLNSGHHGLGLAGAT